MKKNFFKALVFIGIIAAILSIIFSFLNAQLYSVDFQWSPSVTFWKGFNPYDISISDERDIHIILSQDPNYLHPLYILFYPLTMISFSSAKIIWAIVNIFFGISCILFSKKYFQLTVNQTLLVSIFFFCSTPFTNNIGNGQHTLGILLSVFYFWFSKSSLTQIFGLFIIGLKYSFAPFYFLLALFRNKLFIPAIILLYFIFAYLFSFILKENFTLVSLIKPLLVAQNKTSYGVSDLYSLIKYYFNPPFYFTIVFSLLFSFVIHLVLLRYDNEFHLSIISTSSLLLFYHLIYDYIFLLPLLIQFIKHFDKFSKATKSILFICLFYFFYFYKILFKLNIHNHIYAKLFGTVLLTTTIFILIIKYSKIKNVEVLPQQY